MKVFILTEGGKNIGFGHITRCLSLYQAFEERGIKPKFIVNGFKDIEHLLNGENYQLLNWIEKPDKVFELIKDADIAIIDSYLADISLYEKLSNLVKILVYIDDNKRIDYPKGIVVNGGIYAEELDYRRKNEITYILGTKYTPLRKEFWEVPEKKIREKIESIMVTFGGDDAKNMTPKTLKFLNKEYSNLKKNIIIGNDFQNIDKIKKEADKSTNLIYYPDAEKMKEIMLESDIAISAGGQTLYELARVGVSTIGVCVAENQLGNVKGWKRANFLEYTGWHNKIDILEKIKNSIKFLEDEKERKSKSKIGRGFVDGKGSLRIADEIIKNSL